MNAGGEAVPVSEHAKVSKSKPSRRFIILDILASIIWIYSIIKLFVFDIDLYLANKYFPLLNTVIKYKLIVILLLLVLFILIRKNWNLIGDILYIVFFPLIILFWKIPVIFLRIKSWNVFFIFLTYVVTMVRSAKFNFITFTILLSCVVAVFVSTSRIILWPSVFLLLAVALAVILQKIVSVYSGSPILKYVSDAIAFLFDKGKATFALEDEVKALPVEKLTEPQLQKWSTTLQLSVIFCRGCAFITRRLRDFQKSKYSTIVYIMNFLSLLVFTIIAFSFVYYGIFKINHNFFSATNSQFFDFFFFSFNKSIFNSTAEIQAITILPKIITMLQEFLSLCFGTFVILLIFSINDERKSNEVDSVIKKIEKTEKSMEQNIQEQFSLDIINAIKQLEKYSAGMVKFIYILSKDIEEDIK